MRNQRNALIDAVSAVADFVAQHDSGTLTPAEAESRADQLLQGLNITSILNLLDPTTYLAPFDPREHTKVWPWIADHLFLTPDGQAPVRASFPVANAPVFDQRLALPLGSQAAQSLLGIMRGLSPEYRTTGAFRNRLRECSKQLFKLTASIREAALTRTIHTQGDFSPLIDDFYVVDLPFIPGFAPQLKEDYHFVVGALDLSNQNDSFFPDVIKPASVPYPGPSRRGSLDFHWRPPATLARSNIPSTTVHAGGTSVVTYIITNLDACVAAANQQSEQDYADLLISSGYMTLVQLNAVLRHAATQPDHSETVSGNTVLLRSPQKWTPATVHSRDTSILFTLTGDIQAQAQRQEQKVKAFVNCTTQAVDRVPPLLQYRVFLRTIGSAVPPSRWSEPDYTSIQSVSYVADPLNAGFKRLALHTVFDNMLSEKLLIQDTSAPGTRHSEDTLTLQAHTFDWWIPVAPNPKIRNVASATMTNRSSDANQISRLPFGVHASKFAAVSSDSIRNDPSIVAGLGWEDGTQYWQGQHREMSLSSVEVRYKLDWKEDRLHLVVENRPSDRNYVLFLVIEETFGSIEPDEIPPKVLHTAIPVPINGLLTYVPQSFFDQEKAAADKLKALLSKYVETATPKLGDPVARAMRPGETMTDAGAERLVAALQQFDPQMLETLVRARHS